MNDPYLLFDTIQFYTYFLAEKRNRLQISLVITCLPQPNFPHLAILILTKLIHIYI